MSRKKQYIVENTEQPEVTLQDFVIPAKIEAFCEKYKPLSHWSEDCDMFTDYLQGSSLSAGWPVGIVPSGVGFERI